MSSNRVRRPMNAVRRTEDERSYYTHILFLFSVIYYFFFQFGQRPMMSVSLRKVADFCHRHFNGKTKTPKTTPAGRVCGKTTTVYIFVYLQPQNFDMLEKFDFDARSYLAKEVCTYVS